MEALDFPKRHLLVTIDESEASEKACTWALDNLYRAGDIVHLLHVISPVQHVILSSDLGIEEVIEDNEEDQRKVENHARSFLTARYATALDEKKVPYQIEIVRFATDNDSIGSVVCKRAEQLNAACVVMAKHTKTAIKEFFVGSVSNYCSHHCRSPVLIMSCD